MKLFFFLFAVTVSSTLLAQDIHPDIKKVVFDQVVADIFFEDEGLTREPKMEDLKFETIDKNLIRISGSSYSAWDVKEIFYDCQALIESRTFVPKKEEVSVTCSLQGEGWPYVK